MSGLHLPPPEPPAEPVIEQREQLHDALDELAAAQRVVALLDVDAPAPAGNPVAIARGIIERDLAARRVEAWQAVVRRLRVEADRLAER